MLLGRTIALIAQSSFPGNLPTDESRNVLGVIVTIADIKRRIETKKKIRLNLEADVCFFGDGKIESVGRA